MYAIVEIGGKQYRVEKDAEILVDKIESLDSKTLSFESVVLFSGDKGVQVGTPYVKNATVKATVLGVKKGDKVMGVKFKKRKNHTRTYGHREKYLHLKIDDVTVN